MDGRAHGRAKYGGARTSRRSMDELGASGLSKSRQARALGAHRWMAMDMLGVNRLCMAGPVSTELGVARLGVVGLAEEGLVMAGRGATGRKKSTRLVGAWTG